MLGDQFLSCVELLERRADPAVFVRAAVVGDEIVADAFGHRHCGEAAVEVLASFPGDRCFERESGGLT
jgi:hypothetical protein